MTAAGEQPAVYLEQSRSSTRVPGRGEQPAVCLEQSRSSTRVPGRGEQLAVCLEESRPSYLDKPNGTIGTNIHDEILICNKILKLK